MRRSLPVLAAAGFAVCLFTTSAKAQPTMASIGTKMNGVAGDLAKSKTGAPVQAEQKVIVRDLDELIASLEQECENCRGGMKRLNPNVGMPDSFISRGPGGAGPLVDPRASEKDWAKLSSRERDRILQSMTEGFPPEYRQILERYYRRLAEEKTAADRAQPKDGESKTQER
jgi:hypothetical protein